MENDIVEFQWLGAFHAASAMECVMKGDSAHLKMAVWYQNHAADFYDNARRMLTDSCGEFAPAQSETERE